MPYIKVDVKKINAYQQNIYSVRRGVSNISEKFSSLTYYLDSSIRQENTNVDRKIRVINSSMSDYDLLLERMNRFLSNASIQYLNADSKFDGKNENASGCNYGTDIDSLIERIASSKGIDSSDVRDAVFSGKYSIDEIVNTANGNSGGGDFANHLKDISLKKDDKKEQFTEADQKDIVSIAAAELGVTETEIQSGLVSGLYKLADISEFVEGKASSTNKFVSNANKVLRLAAGASKLNFKMKDGYVIVSKFTRDSYFNKLVKKYHDGTGIGTRYTPEVLKNTPVIGTIYKAQKVVDVVDNVTNFIEGANSVINGVADASSKISNIWADDTLTKKEKVIDTVAVGVTSAVGTALDVAAPIAGEAVKQGVTAAITGLVPIPIVGTVVGVAVGTVAGSIVEGGIKLVSDVITSEAVINQVSSSITNVGDAVASGVQAVSNAGKKLLESKNVGDAIKNTANLVGSAVVAGAKVVGTAVVEAVKVAATVVKETVKKAGEAIVNTAKKIGNAVKNFFKKW